MKRVAGRRHRLTASVASVLSVFLVGVAAVPAHAETARDKQWYLDAMQAEKMWEVSKGKGVTVAVIDSGVDSSIPDLQGQVLKGKDFTDLPGGPHDDYTNHGTGIASMIAGTGEAGPAKGTWGLAPEAEILPLRVDIEHNDSADALAAGKESLESVSAAIRYAADSEAQVLNISLASPTKFQSVSKAVRYALSKGKLIFAGVGNDGENGNPVMYPAAHPGVVGVAALDRNVEATDESQHGRQVDLAAPGEEMVHSCTGGTQLCNSHGTSDATAIASASAALIWAEHPDWTANQVTRVLVETAGGPDSGKERTDYVGYGGVRPRIALLEGPVDPGDPKTNPLPGPYYEGNASPSAEPSNGSEKGTGSDDQATAPNADDADEGIGTGAWIAYGLIAAAVLAAAIGIPLYRARRRRAAAPGAPPMPPAPPHAPWPHQHQQTGDRRYN